MRFISSIGLVAALSLACIVSSERDAAACGGCFVPQENNTVVTDHRMILAVAMQETTLYDQIRYSGSPESFAWVLPIAGDAKVTLSSDSLFSALDNLTATVVTPPPRNCPLYPRSCQDGESGALASSAPAPAMAGAASDVTVTHQEVVGPYETVQLHSSKPGALSEWLTQHGYQIPPDIEPVIAGYIQDGFDFLALKLVPGQSIRAMQPVRVTTNGASPKLPLRMVAAGAGAQIGISLWVVGDGRWEPSNFPSFYIAKDEVAWDWTNNKSTFQDVRAKHVSELGDSAWELESSTDVNANNLRSILTSYLYGVGGYPGYPPGYPQPQPQPIDAGTLPDGAPPEPTKTPQQLADEEMTYLTGDRRALTSMRITRMRSDLGRASLGQDLDLKASESQSELSRTRALTREVNEPSCPYYVDCRVAGTAPRSEAISRTNANGGGGCSAVIVGGRRTAATAAGIGLALAVGAFVRRRRRDSR